MSTIHIVHQPPTRLQAGRLQAASRYSPPGVSRMIPFYGRKVGAP